MRNWIGSLGLAVVLAGAGLATTGTTANVSDADLAKKITHEIRMYPHYSVWDDVNFRVDDGQVVLLGEVSQPFKKADLGRIVQKVAGVRSFTNELTVLPLSPMDDRLRLLVARAIYGDPSLSRYGAGALPSITSSWITAGLPWKAWSATTWTNRSPECAPRPRG
jgi:hyperosmotically inducible protein